MDEERDIHIDRVGEILTQSGYEIIGQDESSLRARELSSGIAITSVLEHNVLYNTVSCLTVDSDAITGGTMRKMLDGQNGISTSYFQLYSKEGGKTNITLNNFCKLLAMGADDEDDILACYSFLIVDAFAARELLSELSS